MIDTHVIYERNGIPLITLSRYETRLTDDLAAQCQAELFARNKEASGGNFKSGYLLEVEHQPELFPRSTALLQILRQDVVEARERELDVPFRFSFIKLAAGRSPGMI